MADYTSTYTGAQIDANLALAETAVQPATDVVLAHTTTDSVELPSTFTDTLGDRKWDLIPSHQTTADAALDATGERDHLLRQGWNLDPASRNESYPGFGWVYESIYNGFDGTFNSECYIQYVDGTRDRRPMGCYIDTLSFKTIIPLNGKVGIGDGAMHSLWYFGDGGDVTNGGNGDFFSNGYKIVFNENNKSLITAKDSGGTYRDILNFNSSNTLLVGTAQTTMVSRGKLGIGTYNDNAPSDTLEVAGTIATRRNFVIGSHSVSATYDHIILWNPSSGSDTCTLPTATGAGGADTGRQYIIKNYTASTTANVATTGGQTIDGAATYALGGKKYVCVVAFNNGWHIIGSN